MHIIIYDIYGAFIAVRSNDDSLFEIIVKKYLFKVKADVENVFFCYFILYIFLTPFQLT